MHYGTERATFMEPVDAFLEHVGAVHHVGSTRVDTDDLPADGPLAIVFNAP